MIGDDLEEMTEFMFAHKDSKHRKRFEETNLGRLPIEITVKILGYVTPQCRRCFHQSELFKLRSVCKGMRRLTRLPDFYKEIKLGQSFCSLPPEWIFQSIIKRSGSQLKKISCDWENRKSLYYAIQKRGGVIEKICIGKVCNTWQDCTNMWISGTQMATILQHVNGHNPRALKSIQFGTSDYIWLSFDLARKSKPIEPLFSRIIGLNLHRNGYHLAECIAFANHAMRYIYSLQRVTVTCWMSFNGSETELVRLVQKRVEDHELYSLEDIHVTHRRYSYNINMVLGRKGGHPSKDPRLGFEKFKIGLKKFKDPLG